MRQPSTDYRSTSAESLEAFAAGDKQRSLLLVLEYIRSCRERGSTADQGSAALGLGSNSVAPRFVDLHKAGLIVKALKADGKPLRRTTRQGCAAAVFIAAEFASSKEQQGERDSAPLTLFDDLSADRSYRE